MEIESIEEEHQEKKSKLIFGSLFFILVLGLLIFYWIVPHESAINFINSNGAFLSCSSFEFGNVSDLQFYKNMRYVDSNISYKIENCPIQKRNEAKNAFYEIANMTALSFYEVFDDAEIIVSCDSATKLQNGMFIAGEGGPSNITKLDNSYIILQGDVLLIKESICERPVVAIHEIFHALGFIHSNNVCNIMYNSSKCSQEIGSDMIQLIDELYSYEPLPDLMIINATGNIHSEYLDLNFSVKNDGLIDSKNLFIEIYSNDKVIKKIDIKEIKFGSGVEIVLKNIYVGQNVDEVLINVVYDNEELNTDNNVVKLFL